MAGHGVSCIDCGWSYLPEALYKNLEETSISDKKKHAIT
jgi:hypothetical protein